jgi:hypothetical protein
MLECCAEVIIHSLQIHVMRESYFVLVYSFYQSNGSPTTRYLAVDAICKYASRKMASHPLQF